MINVSACTDEFKTDPSVLFIVNPCKMTNYGRCNTADQTQADRIIMNNHDSSSQLDRFQLKCKPDA